MGERLALQDFRETGRISQVMPSTITACPMSYDVTMRKKMDIEDIPDILT
jgi:hypothetical protein